MCSWADAFRLTTPVRSIWVGPQEMLGSAVVCWTCNCYLQPGVRSQLRSAWGQRFLAFWLTYGFRQQYSYLSCIKYVVTGGIELSGTSADAVERDVTVCNDTAPDSEFRRTCMIYTWRWIVTVLIMFRTTTITTTTTATATTTTITTIIIIITTISSSTISLSNHFFFCTFATKNSYYLLSFSSCLSVCLTITNAEPLKRFQLNSIFVLFTKCYDKFCLKFEENNGNTSTKACMLLRANLKRNGRVPR